MSYDYDKLYGETRDALGQPTQVLVDFFDQLDRQGLRVLDVGCGQGRDAIFIARKGHRVVGIDISANGIRDLNLAAKKENLSITGLVEDIVTFVPRELYDVILIDRTLHMLAEPARLAVLNTMLDHVAVEGWLLIADEASNISAFMDVVADHGARWATETSKLGYLFLRRI